MEGIYFALPNNAEKMLSEKKRNFFIRFQDDPKNKELFICSAKKIEDWIPLFTAILFNVCILCLQYCKSGYLRLGEIYTSYAVNWKPHKIPPHVW